MGRRWNGNTRFLLVTAAVATVVLIFNVTNNDMSSFVSIPVKYDIYRKESTEKPDAFSEEPSVKTDIFDKEPSVKTDIFDKEPSVKTDIFDKEPSVKTDSFSNEPTVKPDIFGKDPTLNSDIFSKKSKVKFDIFNKESTVKPDLSSNELTKKSDISSKESIVKSDISINESISDSVQQELKSAELTWLKQNSIIREAEKSLKSEDDFSRLGNSPGKVEFWEHFYPSFRCPYELERIGRSGDGGKWVCGLEEIAKKSKCVVYSFGVNRETTFEEEIATRTRCRIHMFELNKQIEAPQWVFRYPERVTFTKLGIGNEDTEDKRTLKTFMESNNDEFADIFKIDIESGEWSALERILTDYPDKLPFGQMQIEVHLNYFKPEHQYVVMRNFWYSMQRSGLRPCHDEPNQQLFREFSFLNIRSNMFKLEQDINSKLLKWPLDSKYLQNPSNFLNGF